MKTYNIEINVAALYFYEGVKAETREDAIEIARERARHDVRDLYCIDLAVIGTERVYPDEEDECDRNQTAAVAAPLSASVQDSHEPMERED